jgi:hypothetical protein
VSTFDVESITKRTSLRGQVQTASTLEIPVNKNAKMRCFIRRPKRKAYRNSQKNTQQGDFELKAPFGLLFAFLLRDGTYCRADGREQRFQKPNCP